MKSNSGILRSPLLWLVLAVILAVGLKTWLVVGGWLPFNADEAVVALMARHILQGERPVFFYGQAYMGSLDGFLVAGAFALFGEHVWAVRMVQILLYVGFLATTAWLGRAVFGRWKVGVLGALLLAIPTVNVTLYTTVSLGGYGEALLLGNLILLCTLGVRDHMLKGEYPGPVYLWALFGFFSGLGLWAFGLTLVYSLPALAYLLALAWKHRRLTRAQNPVDVTSVADLSVSGDRHIRHSAQDACPGGKSHPFLALSSMAGASFIGSLPWWLYGLQNGIPKLLNELGGGAIAGVEGLPWVSQVVRHAVNLLLLGSTVTIGLRPPWDVSWLGLPLLPFVLTFWLGVLIFAVRKVVSGSWEDGPILLAGVMLALVLVFIASPFGVDPSGRYFLPLAAPLALFASELILALRDRTGILVYGLAGLLLVYNLWGTIQSARDFPPGITTQFYAPSQIDHRYDHALIDFLRQNGEMVGYSNYWVTYPLAFLSEEALIYVPRLPYHLDFRYTERDDRYPPYGERVAASSKTAYITTHHPVLDENLRQKFTELGITWQEAQIGDYNVFYALSRSVSPPEVGLGKTTSP